MKGINLLLESKPREPGKRGRRAKADEPSTLYIIEGGTFSGEGNCCGWYGAEFIKDGTIHGYIADNQHSIYLLGEPKKVKKTPITSIYSPENDLHEYENMESLLGYLAKTHALKEGLADKQFDLFWTVLRGERVKAVVRYMETEGNFLKFAEVYAIFAESDRLIQFFSQPFTEVDLWVDGKVHEEKKTLPELVVEQYRGWQSNPKPETLVQKLQVSENWKHPEN